MPRIVNAWTREEDELLEILYPCLGKATCKVLRALGFDRSEVGCLHRANRTGVKFDKLQMPKMRHYPDGTDRPWDAPARHAIYQALGLERESEEVTPAQQTRPARVVDSDQAWRALLDAVGRVNVKGDEPVVIEPPEYQAGDRWAVLALSDVHYGAVEHDFDGGVIYSPAICEMYLAEIPEMLTYSMPPSLFSGLIVLLMGDMVDGELIFPGQQSELGLALYDQLGGSWEALWDLLCSLQARYGRVNAVCVPGNHGRLGKYYAKRSNADKILYAGLALKAGMRGDENITIQQSWGNVGLVELLGHKIMLRHVGVDQDGTAAKRGRLADWRNIHKYDCAAQGHQHSFGVMDYHSLPVARCPAMKPPAEFAEKNGYWGVPAQACWWMDEKRPLRGYDWLIFE